MNNDKDEKILILDLVLKGVWYDLINCGIKTEEYREIKDYWRNRLREKLTCEGITLYGDYKPYKYVRFRRGYTSCTMLFKIEDIYVGYGNPEWGAPVNKSVYIIKLGERVDEKSLQNKKT